MSRASALACLFALAAAPLAAGPDEPHPSLSQVMQGATAMATVGNGFVFVAKPDSAWVCGININAKHFAALMSGDSVVAEQTVPGAVCVPATHFQNLME